MRATVALVLLAAAPACKPSPHDHRDQADAARSSCEERTFEGDRFTVCDPDGASRFRRNGAGVTGGGRAVFAISETKVSFGKFARLFRDELGCDSALYFDGDVSSLWDPARERKDESKPLGPFLVVVSPR